MIEGRGPRQDTSRTCSPKGMVRAAASRAGFKVLGLRDAFLRMKYGNEVIGLFAVLQK